jgi:predicted nuclease of predicted toxin-antitoxin system
MAKYLIDANLPYYLSLWNTDDYIHLNDLDDSWTDEQVWDYAVENGLTIVTKDSDFSNRILLRDPPPKVIHIRFGNMKIKEFRERLISVWKDACEISETHKLVNVFIDRIEAIQ